MMRQFINTDTVKARLQTKTTTVNSRYLKVEVYPKLLISQSKFSGPRKFTLRYQWYETKAVGRLFWD